MTVVYASLCNFTEEELGQGEDSVTIEDVTNNPAAQIDLDDTHNQDIVEPDEPVSVSPLFNLQ